MYCPQQERPPSCPLAPFSSRANRTLESAFNTFQNSGSHHGHSTSIVHDGSRTSSISMGRRTQATQDVPHFGASPSSPSCYSHCMLFVDRCKISCISCELHSSLHVHAGAARCTSTSTMHVANGSHCTHAHSNTYTDTLLMTLHASMRCVPHCEIVKPCRLSPTHAQRPTPNVQRRTPAHALPTHTGRLAGRRVPDCAASSTRADRRAHEGAAHETHRRSLCGSKGID
jgi:hypothetical protein